MIAYASRTGTRSTLAALRHHGWRLMVSAAGEMRTEGFDYALDNGAWTAFQRGSTFDEARFARALATLGDGADFVVMPDIVCGGEESLELSFRWMRRVLDSTAVGLIAVQDGHEPWQVVDLLGPSVGVFVGGSTEWKLGTLVKWAAICRERGALCHVGRVNTARRIAACGAAGATSFDGSSVALFPASLGLLARAADQARRQTALILDAGEVACPWTEVAS